MLSSSYSYQSPPLLFVDVKPHKPSSSKTCHIISLHTGFQEISQIAQNKVLVAATVACAIGQFSKPFTSALLYDDNLEDQLHFRSLSRAGGFPSVHTAGVVAGATSLGLERGLSDSIFGMSVIFAAIVMYDAQAVRWEVGQHAKLLNKAVVVKTKNQSHIKDTPAISNPRTSVIANSEAPVPLLSVSEQTSCMAANSNNPQPYLTPETSVVVRSNLHNNGDPALKGINNNYVPLEESIGHTPVEVVGGAFLGFISSLVIYTLL